MVPETLPMKVVLEFWNGCSYGQEIANNLNKDQASVAEVISKLCESGFLQKKQRTKAQHYGLTEEGVSYAKSIERILKHKK